MAVDARVAATVRKRTLIVAGWIENGPARKAEIDHTHKVRQHAGRLAAIAVRELALVARYRPKLGAAMGCANILELPNAGWLAGRNPAEVLRVLQEATYKEASQPGRRRCSNDADREMDKLVAIVRSALLVGQLAWQSPRVLPVTTGLRP